MPSSTTRSRTTAVRVRGTWFRSTLSRPTLPVTHRALYGSRPVSATTAMTARWPRLVPGSRIWSRGSWPRRRGATTARFSWCGTKATAYRASCLSSSRRLIWKAGMWRLPTITTPFSPRSKTSSGCRASARPRTRVPLPICYPAPVRDLVLAPSVGPDHAREPEQRTRACDERGANDRPLAASGHERTRYDPDALKEEDRSREERDDGDYADGESHGHLAPRAKSARTNMSSVRTTISEVHVSRPWPPDSQSRCRRSRDPSWIAEARSGRQGRLDRRGKRMVQLNGPPTGAVLGVRRRARRGGRWLTHGARARRTGRPWSSRLGPRRRHDRRSLAAGLLGWWRQGRVGVPGPARGRRARDRSGRQRRVVARSVAGPGLSGLALTCLAGARGRRRGPGHRSALDAGAEGSQVLARSNEFPSAGSGGS